MYVYVYVYVYMYVYMYVYVYVHVYVYVYVYVYGCTHIHRRAQKAGMQACSIYILSFLRRAPPQQLHARRVCASFWLQTICRRAFVSSGIYEGLA